LKLIYATLVAIDAIVVAILVFFFLWGLTDGTVSSFNGALWLVMLVVPIGLLVGGMLSWRHGQRAMALVLLLVPAVPASLMGLMLLMFLILQPDMR
jgi:hypothetical protein